MKTTKLFLSIALVALTAISYGKISEPINDCDCCPTEIVYEQELDMENWMSVPFEASVENEALSLESWMTTPFEASVENEVLSLESWMTTPFETTEDIEFEKCMAAVWN